MSALGTASNQSGGQQVFRCAAAVDLPSMNTVTSGTVSVTVTGAAIGDLVLVFPTTALTTGVSVDGTCALVATADTVIVRATNDTAGTVDPASQIMNFIIFRNQNPL